MGLDVKIKKQLGMFELDIEFQSDSKRIGILGASGCGKSMTLKCIAGIEQPDVGKIVKEEKIFFDSECKVNVKPQKRSVGYLFQNYALFPTMTVEENISAGLSGRKEDIQKRVKEMIDIFHLQGLEKRFPGKLSGGQQQRVALARIMAYEPEMILLDEPFSALDVYLRDEMQREMLELLKDYKGIVILVSHNRDEIYRMSEEMLVLENGKLVCQGNTKKIFEQPKYLEVARLTGCKNIVGVERKKEGLFVKDWDMLLSDLDKEANYIAIRAHQFRIQETERNMFVFPVKNLLITEDLFEYNVSFLTSEGASERVNWKVSKELWNYGKDEVPRQLYLKREDLLLLE